MRKRLGNKKKKIFQNFGCYFMEYIVLLYMYKIVLIKKKKWPKGGLYIYEYSKKNISYSNDFTHFAWYF